MAAEGSPSFSLRTPASNHAEAECARDRSTGPMSFRARARSPASNAATACAMRVSSGFSAGDGAGAGVVSGVEATGSGPAACGGGRGDMAAFGTSVFRSAGFVVAGDGRGDACSAGGMSGVLKGAGGFSAGVRDGRRSKTKSPATRRKISGSPNTRNILSRRYRVSSK